MTDLAAEIGAFPPARRITAAPAGSRAAPPATRGRVWGVALATSLALHGALIAFVLAGRPPQALIAGAPNESPPIEIVLAGPAAGPLPLPALTASEAETMARPVPLALAPVAAAAMPDTPAIVPAVGATVAIEPHATADPATEVSPNARRSIALPPVEIAARPPLDPAAAVPALQQSRDAPIARPVAVAATAPAAPAVAAATAALSFEPATLAAAAAGTTPAALTTVPVAVAAARPASAAAVLPTPALNDIRIVETVPAAAKEATPSRPAASVLATTDNVPTTVVAALDAGRAAAAPVVIAAARSPEAVNETLPPREAVSIPAALDTVAPPAVRLVPEAAIALPSTAIEASAPTRPPADMDAIASADTGLAALAVAANPIAGVDAAPTPPPAPTPNAANAQRAAPSPGLTVPSARPAARQPASAPTTGDRPAPAAGGKPKAASATPNQTATSGTGALTNYRGEVLSRLRRQAAGVAPVATGTGFVAFTIAANGGVSGVRLAKGSGQPALDRQALEVVARAGPFPPLPAELGPELDFLVPIAFSLR